MKKIDLHIHTIATSNDSYFDFDLFKLKEYVQKLEIDCIAITNHNVFDLNQYNEICKALDIVVYPGIEIDLNGGHLLLISDKDDLFDFTKKCAIINNLKKTQEDYISVEKFKEIFPSLSRYLLIPHYHKNPILSQQTIKELDTLISSGEVSSIKKFKSCIKDKDSLVPLILAIQDIFLN